ncbi:MAG: hypothetical protein EB168_09325 [Euryarchaeota archaeon]|nr:hypothetical protein [Euryarchaeota archaeon]
MPSPFDKLKARRINDSLKIAGTFWSERLQDRMQAYHLVGACYKSAVLSMFKNTARRLTNEHKEMIEGAVLTFDPFDVFRTGGALTDPDLKLDAAPNALQSISKLNEGGLGDWGLQLRPVRISPEDPRKYLVEPVLLDSMSRPLVRDVDFHVHNGLLLFHQDPRHLFPDNTIPFALGELERESIHSFPLGSVEARDTKFVTRYARVSQSPGDFALAAASVGGLEIVPKNSVLRHKVVQRDRTVYTFEDFVMHVTYPHTELTEGVRYTKGHIIGDGLKLNHHTGADPHWWRKINFRGGLSLGTLAGKKGVTVPDKHVRAWLDGKHLRLALEGAPDEVTAYWDSVAAVEDATGTYLNDLVQLEAGQETQLNALDLFFEGFLDLKTIILEIDAGTVTDLSALLRFIDTNKPVGSLTLVLLEYPAIDSDVNLSGVVTDTVRTYAMADVVTVSEILDLSSIIVDSSE